MYVSIFFEVLPEEEITLYNTQYSFHFAELIQFGMPSLGSLEMASVCVK